MWILSNINSEIIWSSLSVSFYLPPNTCSWKSPFTPRFGSSRQSQVFTLIYSECSIIRHPPSQLKKCRITNCRIIESKYIAKYSPCPINYPLIPVDYEMLAYQCRIIEHWLYYENEKGQMEILLKDVKLIKYW